MLTVACVWTEDRYPIVYVERLRQMVGAGMGDTPFRFVVLTDRPDEVSAAGMRADAIAADHGFWAKVECFRPGRFEGRVLYLDLDVVILRSLKPLWRRPNRGAYDGGIIDDWHMPGFNSSVMCWDAGRRDDVWQAYQNDPEGWRQRLHGDQDLITKVYPHWPTFPEGICISYKGHRALHGSEMPKEAIVVCFHGQPKQDVAQFEAGWVHDAWTAGLPLGHLDTV